MSKFKIFFSVVVISLATGCASNKYPVTIASNPAGAEVFCNGESYGYAPITRHFELDEATKNYGYLRTCQWQLRWVSGATASVNNVYDLNKFPSGVLWTTPRPDAQNAHIDHQFALQLNQNKQMNQVLQNTQEIQGEQNRVKQQKQYEDNTQYLCNLGLLNHPGCKRQMLTCKSFFEISVYRLEQEDYYGHMSAHIAKLNAGNQYPLDKNYLRENYGGEWQYNEIIGFLRFYRYGANQIRCEYWETDAKKKVRTRKKRFVKLSDCYCKELFSNKAPNSELAEVMKRAVELCENLLKKRFLDREIFDNMVDFIDWRALLS